MHDVNHTGAQVRRLRRALAMSQHDLTVVADVTQGLISRVENGKVVVTDELLDQLAGALRCHPSFLTTKLDTIAPTRPWLRAYADAPKKDVEQQLADCSVAADVIELLNLRTLPDTIPTFDGDLNDDDAIEAFASEVRTAAGIEDGEVLRNVMRAAERLGCVVLPMRGELGRHLGMSTYANLNPMICTSRPSSQPDHPIPGDRQRFTVAHELGHLGLHRGMPAPRDAAQSKRIEKQAHRFAGAFLIPGDALVDEIGQVNGRVTLRTLEHIKASWGIAIKALVVRCRQLQIITDDHARSLYKQISSRGWNKSEPVHVGHEHAVWFDKALRKSYAQQPDPIESAAHMAGLDRSHLDRWLNWAPIGDDAQIIALPDRPAHPPTQGAGDATVTSLRRRG